MILAIELHSSLKELKITTKKCMKQTMKKCLNISLSIIKISLDVDAKILDKDNTWKYIKINSKLKRRSATGDHHLEK